VVHGEPDRFTGLLLAPCDIQGLAAGLERMLRQPALRRPDSAARAALAEQFSHQRMTARIRELYLQLEPADPR
jgi:glycosyltransferase involved in cell wall biosynthesis